MSLLQYTLIKNSHLQQLHNEKKILKEEIHAAKSFIKKIEDGNLDIQIDLKNHQETGLFEALLQMQQQLKKLSDEERKQNWITKGLAKFAEIMRSISDLKSFGDTMIANLVNYLKACQGGLFILREEQDEEPYLEMIACYAYDRKKFLKKKVFLGEGLLGQVFLESKTLQMDKIPENYLNVNSGLGDAPPHYLLLVPIKQQGKTHGMLELSSFEAFKSYQIEFLERIGESIASAVSTAKINEKTQVLLQESQEQAEMLRAQEEEMRQNNEELFAIQESLQAKQIELEKALQVTNEQASLLKQQEVALIASERKMQTVVDNLPRAIFWKDNDLIYQGCNKIFAAIAGLNDSKEIIGKSDYDLPWGNETADLYREDDRYVIDHDKPKIDFEEPMENDEGIKTWLRTSKVPIVDEQGNSDGVLGMFEDITQEKEKWNNLNQKAQELEELKEKFLHLQSSFEKYKLENKKLKSKIRNLQGAKSNPFKNN